MSYSRSVLVFVTKALFSIMCLALYASSESASVSGKLKNIPVVFNKIKSLEVCHELLCVSESAVLGDLFPKQNISIIDNYGISKDKSLIHVIYSAKFSVGKDLYGFFITQANAISSQQVLENCHACGATLGVAIYQFHNKWKLFGAQPNLGEAGANGKISIEDKSFSIYPMGTERFMITYDTYDQGQGFEVTSRNLIFVNSDLLSSITTNGKNEINYYGFFPVRESSCNARDDGDFWNGLVTFENTEAFIPRIIMQKIKGSCLTKKTIQVEKVVVSKSGSEKRLVETVTR